MMNKIVDSHVHTEFSSDGHDSVADILADAKERGFYYLATTDHLDMELKLDKRNHTPVPWKHIDLDKYQSAWLEAAKNAGDVKFRFGIEAGYGHKQEVIDAYQNIIAKYDFDVVINSVHFVDGWDVYFQNAFFLKPKRHVYSRYLDTVLKSLDAPYQYDIVAHMGYVTRNAPYCHKEMTMREFGEKIDAVLKGVIERDKALEVNTHHDMCPTEEILKRYFELGGRKISFGSDSHRMQTAKDRETVCRKLVEIGFKDFSCFTKHVEEKVPIEC